MLSLIVTKGTNQGQIEEIKNKKHHVIGRLSTAWLRDDRSVSRIHAELVFDRGRWYVSDMSSTNGTYVNGKRISEKTVIQNGDQIRIGKNWFVVDHSAKEAQTLGQLPQAAPVRRVTVGELPLTESDRNLLIPAAGESTTTDSVNSPATGRRIVPRALLSIGLGMFVMVAMGVAVVLAKA